MAATLAPVERFHNNLVALGYMCASLVETLYKERLTQLEPAYVRMGVAMLQHSDKEQLLELFIEHSYPYWNQLYVRDEQFFQANVSKIFPTWDARFAGMFAELFDAHRPDGSKAVGQEARDGVWKILHNLVKIAIHHISEQRKPVRRGGVIEWTLPEYANIDTPMSVLVAQWDIAKTLRV